VGGQQHGGLRSAGASTGGQAARVHAEFWSLRWLHLESARTRWNITEAQAKSHRPGWADAAVDYIAFIHLALPQHVALFLALLELERSGCRTHGNSGEELIDARHARAAYEQYARPDLEPRDDDILALRSDADLNAVMRVPELVLRYDWTAFARETGVYTNEKHLRDLVKCCFVKSLTDALKERGRQQLLAPL
jgi:hypothetical protein